MIKNKTFINNLALFSLVMILIITLLFATHKSPFEYTFSMIGNWFELKYRIQFIIWGILTGGLLTFFLVHLYKETKFKNKKAFRSLYASTIFLILTVITPTVTKEIIPKELREPSFDPHFIYGISFAILLITSLYLFSNYLSKYNYTQIKTKKIFAITIIIPFIALIIFGMTGVFEIVFFISISIFLWRINSEVKQKL